jgi:hypothetical protein
MQRCKNKQVGIHKARISSHRKYLGLIAFMLCFGTAHAGYVISCNNAQPNMGVNTIFVDCSSRRDVLRGIGIGWKLMREQGIRGGVEDLCYRPYSQLQKLHPAISMRGIAQTFIMQCNSGLRYLE